MAPITSPYVPNQDPNHEFRRIAELIGKHLNRDSAEVKGIYEDEVLCQHTSLLLIYLGAMVHEARREFDMGAYVNRTTDFGKLADEIEPNFEISDGHYLAPLVARMVHAVRWYLKSDDQFEKAIINFKRFVTPAEADSLDAVREGLQGLFPHWSW